MLAHVDLDRVLVDARIFLLHNESAQPGAELLVVDAERGRFDDFRVAADQVLDLGREHVFPTGDDHFVIAAADVEQPVVVEIAEVARGQQPIDDLLAAAAGVSLERHRVADEDAAHLSLRQLVTLLVEDLHLGALDDWTDRRRIELQVGRTGDRRERDLGGAVQVVDHRPQPLGRPGRQLRAQLRSRYEHDPQCRQVVAAISVVERVEDPRQHHRHHDKCRGPVLFDVVDHCEGSESTAQQQRGTQRHRYRPVQVAERVEHRRRQRRHLAGLERHMRQDAADRGQRRRRVPGGALRCTGRAAREDHQRGVLRRLGCGLLAAARDHFGQRLVGGAGWLVAVGVRAQRTESAQFEIRLRHRLGVLIVVDQQPRALAVGDIRDLRSGEFGVEQHDARADTGGRVVRDDEPAVVSSQDRDAVAALDAHGDHAVGDRVDAVVEFPERHRALVVDDRDAVRRAAGIDRGDHPDFPPPRDIGGHRGDGLR